ncbi:MtrAB system histidine kinase MtrB [Gulosibacter sp. 10]|uniref:MtrAB system histidine kinase MtrB n=1 Tax=Gulosibacter sp. 10 TaxID=1255570 RepID=UPI00097EF50C|nr:MtrAB system histidine kinase MtrB [Gulosibacter sp. 10]SJM54403.1 Sensor histidine kinase MtrB [Gulosibacter sp. 10]
MAPSWLRRLRGARAEQGGEVESITLSTGLGKHVDDLDRSVDPPHRWWRPRGFAGNVRFLWRTSLPFRTTLIAVVLTTTTVVVVALVMGNSIARDLNTSRTNQVMQEAAHAVAAAQLNFDQGTETEELALTALRQQALDAAVAQAPNSEGWAFYLASETNERAPMQDVASQEVPRDLVSQEMRTSVRDEPGTQFSQSVTLRDEAGHSVPGLVVGSTVNVPTVGLYELYFVYSMQPSQDTLDFVQRTLAISMVILVLMVGTIVGGIMRAVIRPIRIAATTSRKLAAGRLEERIPERGEDDIGTLARSFNDMADNLQRQIEQLENLSKVQQRFVSDVSHELRTPLTTIRLAAGIVYARKDELDPTVSRSTELLHDQIERFELLLADLLEISRYDAGAVQLLRKPDEAVHLVEDVVGSMTQAATDQGVALVVRAAAEHIDAEFDERRITRIVRNLVANAIEHSEGKPVVVTVDANATAVAIAVRDYGIGMTEDQQTQVFDRFWRADPSRKRTMGGSGLGLAISQEDAQLHNGRLEVWSAPSLGTNFRLTIPREVDSPIVSSPLPLIPEDAGADTYIVDRGDRRSAAAAEPSLETQPLDLPWFSTDEIQRFSDEELLAAGPGAASRVPRPPEDEARRAPEDDGRAPEDEGRVPEDDRPGDAGEDRDEKGDER